jgi:hypothetical protein
MRFNPTNLNFLAIKQKSLVAKALECDRKPIPGLNCKYNEENFVEFTVQSPQGPLKLQTYRENPE